MSLAVEKRQNVRSYVDHRGRRVREYERRRPYTCDHPTVPMLKARKAFTESAYDGFGLRGFKDGVPAVAAKVRCDMAGKRFTDAQRDILLSRSSEQKRKNANGLSAIIESINDFSNSIKYLALSCIDLKRTLSGQHPLYSDRNNPIEVRRNKYVTQ